MISFDQHLFRLINSEWTHPWLNAFMPWVTDLHKNQTVMVIAIPTLLLLWFYRSRKQMLVALVGLLISIALADNFIYRVLKPSFERPRPPYVEKTIELRSDRYAGYSFPSNHAANNFAAAGFLSLCYPALTPVFLLVASIVGYSRIYVGVHYPLDVIAGGVIGLIFGLFFFRIWRIILSKAHRRWPFLPLLKVPPVKGESYGNTNREF